MNLAEWFAWWRRSGERQLKMLLGKNWDPFDDPDFRHSVEERLIELGRLLHEGATRVDVQEHLQTLRHTRWPSRSGRKWTTRDRRTAEKVIVWYREATGE